MSKNKEKRELIRTLAKKHGWGLSDMYSAMPQMPKSSRNADGVHFNEDGYKTLANIAINAIKTQI